MSCPKDQKVGWLEQLTFIRHYAMNTCSTPWQVYVETGIRADLNLVLNLSGISMTEAVYTLLRPKAGRIQRHGGGRGEKNKRYGKSSKLHNFTVPGEEAIPDSAELVADTVQTITEWERPSYSNLGTYIFDIAKPIIRGAYYITMVTAATDFAYDWYSGILLAPESKCTLGRFGFLYAIGPRDRFAYEPWNSYAQIFPPIGCFRTINGIEVPDGTWALTLRLGGDNREYPYHDATYFVQMVLGPEKDQPCGPPAVVEMPGGAAYTEVRTIRKVKGPDIINFEVALACESPGHLVSGFAMDLRAFRI